jgi:hypothetical protein
MLSVRAALQRVQQLKTTPLHTLRPQYLELEQQLSLEALQADPQAAVEMYTCCHAVLGDKSTVLGPLIQSSGFIKTLNSHDFRKLASVLCRKSAFFHSWAFYSDLETELVRRLDSSLDLQLLSEVLGMFARRKLVPDKSSLERYEKLIQLKSSQERQPDVILNILQFYAQNQLHDSMALLHKSVAPQLMFLGRWLNFNQLLSSTRCMLMLGFTDSTYWKHSFEAIAAKLKTNPLSTSTVALSTSLGLLRTLDALQCLVPHIYSENAGTIQDIEALAPYNEQFTKGSQTTSAVEKEVQKLLQHLNIRAEYGALVEKYYVVDIKILMNILQIDGSTHYIRTTSGLNTNVLCGKDTLQDSVLRSKGYVIKRIPTATLEKRPQEALKRALKELGLV